MALLSSGVVGRISGRVGGIEVAQVGGRSVLKKSKGRQSSGSDRRIFSQTFLSIVKQNWQGLTDGQRIAWETAARGKPRSDRFGVKRCLSGYQLYLSMPRWPIFFGGQPYFYDPPINPVGSTFHGTVHAVAPQHLDYDIDDMGGEGALVVQLQVSRFRPNNGEAAAYTWRDLGAVGSSGGSTLFDTNLAAKGISFIAGERIRLRSVVYNLTAWPFYSVLPMIVVAAP